MLITVPTTNANLTSLLSANQLAIASSNRKTGAYDILLVNDHATLSFYIEIGDEAVVGEAVEIVAGGVLNLSVNNLGLINLIAETENNAVKIIFS